MLLHHALDLREHDVHQAMVTFLRHELGLAVELAVSLAPAAGRAPAGQHSYTALSGHGCRDRDKLD